MGIGWIDTIYNNTASPYYLQSIDGFPPHDGEIKGDDGSHFKLDDKRFHALNPTMRFHADWCGIPWYYNGQHYKAVSLDQQKQVQFCTSQVDGGNWIIFTDYMTGNIIGRQSIPKNDFHCNLRLDNDGVYIDVVNSGQGLDAAVTYLWSVVQGVWTQVAPQVLAAGVKAVLG